MPRIVSAVPLDKYQLRIQFDDGTGGVLSIEDRLFGPVFEPLRDQACFQRVFVDEFGVVCWPNGADLAPDAINERLRGAPQIA